MVARVGLWLSLIHITRLTLTLTLTLTRCGGHDGRGRAWAGGWGGGRARRGGRQRGGGRGQCSSGSRSAGRRRAGGRGGQWPAGAAAGRRAEAVRRGPGGLTLTPTQTLTLTLTLSLTPTLTLALALRKPRRGPGRCARVLAANGGRAPRSGGLPSCQGREAWMRTDERSVPLNAQTTCYAHTAECLVLILLGDFCGPRASCPASDSVPRASSWVTGTHGVTTTRHGASGAPKNPRSVERHERRSCCPCVL